MFILPACMFLLVRVMATRPTVKTDSATQGDVKVLFQLDSHIAWEEHLNFSSMSCDEIHTWTSTTLRLQNQSLMSFPDCLPELLEQLDLSVNLLPELNGQHIAYLPKLQVLSLRQNQILQVIWGAESLSSLQFMDLSFNLLSFVPACMTTSLDNLRWLSLAGNPITEIQPFAFSCYPQLHFLNLSSTWLGKNGKEGIQESAFALNSPHNGDSDDEKVRHAAISVLDLSATFLERIHQDWIKDLPRLTSFYLTKMSKLRSLDSMVFHSVPMLRELDCRDSHVLSVVETESFNHVPNVAVLIFKNCNLSFFNPWNLTSSNALVVNLYGNPLICHCAISWLFSEPDKVVLQRASETMCHFSPENKETSSSGSKALSKLNDECQGQTTIHSTSSIIQDKFYSTSASITRDAQPISSTLPRKSYSDSFTPQSTPFTWGDVTKQDIMRADILAYKEQNTSTNHSLTTVNFQAVFSTILREISTEQTLVSTVEMDKIKQEATTPHQSALPSVTSEVTGMSSELSNSLLIPLSTTDSNWNNLSLQDGTETTSHPKLAPTNNPIYYVDDYDYENNQVASVTQTIGLCDYDPCRHLQKPCTDLQKTTPCLCPGTSDEFTIPDPPRFREISEMRDTSAQIHWCSPNSAVRSYQLVYRLKSSKNYTVAGEIYATARRYTLYNLLPGSTYQVCIIASNKAGSSQTTGWNEYNTPCSTFVTKSSYRTIFAALCATSGLFLIATILLSVCLCKKCKTPHIEQYNTHLVSYKNPAFDYSLK